MRQHAEYHPHGSVVASIAETLRDAHAAAVPGAFRIVVERLSDRYGRRLVDRALLQYEKAMRQEHKRENRRLERPEPTAVEILAMDLSDLQDDVAELHRRLSGKGKLSEAEAEAERVERKQRYERMLALVQAKSRIGWHRAFSKDENRFGLTRRTAESYILVHGAFNQLGNALPTWKLPQSLRALHALAKLKLTTEKLEKYITDGAIKPDSTEAEVVGEKRG